MSGATETMTEPESALPRSYSAGAASWQNHARQILDTLSQVETLEIAGRITRVTGLVIEASGLHLPIGSLCHIPLSEGNFVDAEVVGPVPGGGIGLAVIDLRGLNKGPRPGISDPPGKAAIGFSEHQFEPVRPGRSEAEFAFDEGVVEQVGMVFIVGVMVEILVIRLCRKAEG